MIHPQQAPRGAGKKDDVPYTRVTPYIYLYIYLYTYTYIYIYTYTETYLGWDLKYQMGVGGRLPLSSNHLLPVLVTCLQLHEIQAHNIPRAHRMPDNAVDPDE